MSFELLKLGLKTDNVDINRFANLFHQDGSKLDDFGNGFIIWEFNTESLQSNLTDCNN